MSPVAAPAVFAGGGAFAGVGRRAGAGALGVPGREAALGARDGAADAFEDVEGATGASSDIASTPWGWAIEGAAGAAIGAGATMASAAGAACGASLNISGALAGAAAAPHPVTSWRAARCASAAAKRRTAGDLG